MPTNVTHAIPAIAIGLGLSRYYIGGKAIAIGAVIASVPDLDMLGTRFFGIPWDSIYGHRGYTHSITFAILAALTVAFLLYRHDFKKYFLFFLVCTVSHPLLDSLNNGGLGVAFFWPFSDARYHAFVQPVMNVNVSFRGLYLTMKGLPVFLSEFIWVWLPFFCIYLFLRFNGLELIRNKFQRF